MPTRYTDAVLATRPTIYIPSVIGNGKGCIDRANRNRSWSRIGAGGSQAGQYGLADGGRSYWGVSQVEGYHTPSDTAFDFTTAATWNAWIYIDAVSLKSLLNRDDGSVTRGFQFRLSSSHKVELILFIGGATVLTGLTTVPGKEWTMVSATYDGANMRVFINGQQDNSKAQTGSNNTPTRRLDAWQFTGSGQQFVGFSHHLTFWAGRALGQYDLLNLYRAYGRSTRAA